MAHYMYVSNSNSPPHIVSQPLGAYQQALNVKEYLHCVVFQFS